MRLPHWKSAALAAYAAEAVPREAGVYVLLHVDRTMGVPLRAEPIYVGKTQDLRRRLC